MRPQLPKMEELMKHVSFEITRLRKEELQMSRRDLVQAYGQLELSAETSRASILHKIRVNVSGYYCYTKEFYGQSNLPTNFRKNLCRTVNYQTPVRLNDIRYDSVN